VQEVATKLSARSSYKTEVATKLR